MFSDILEGMSSTFVDLIMGFVELPVFPEQLSTAVAMAFEWMGAAMGILDFFCPLDAIAPAITFFILVAGIKMVYHVVMWVLRKIPFIGIE